MEKNLLRRRVNARNVSIRISLQSWPIHIIKPVGKTKLSYNRTPPHKSCFPSSYVVLFPIALHRFCLLVLHQGRAALLICAR